MKIFKNLYIIENTHHIVPNNIQWGGGVSFRV